jgi:hypothetical protein
MKKTYHRRFERAGSPQQVRRNTQVPRQRLSERARGRKPVVQRHTLDRIGTHLEVMHGEDQPAPDEAGPWWGQASLAEAVLERAPPDPACLSDAAHTERLPGMLEAEAEDGEQGRGHF